MSILHHARAADGKGEADEKQDVVVRKGRGFQKEEELITMRPMGSQMSLSGGLAGRLGSRQ
jgi:hypothetical protein